MTHIAHGLHYGLTSEQYHSDPAPRPSLSSSLAKTLLNQTPRHAWVQSPRLNPNWEPDNRKTFDIGRAAHRAVLGRGDDYAAYPAELLDGNGNATTKAAKEWAQTARDAGITPLKAADVDQVNAMATVAKAALADMGITLDSDLSEVAALAEIDGVWCRCLVDNAPERPIVLPGVGARKVLIDFKTIEDASPASCRRAVENYGYDIQWQHYVETWREASGEDRAFLFVFQEKSEPYEVGVVHLLSEPGHSADWGEDAADKVHEARGTWGECLASNVWPGYPRQIIQIGSQPFYRQRWQDTAVRTRLQRSAIAAATEWQAPHRIAGE